MRPNGTRPPADKPGSITHVVTEALVHRGELASLEFEEACQHGAVTAHLAAAGLGLLILAGVAFTLAVTAAVWDLPHRGLILSLLGLAYAAAGIAVGLAARRRLALWHPFRDTARQFREDCDCVREIAQSLDL